MDARIIRCFTSDELGLCLDSSLSRASLDCRLQMMSGACFKENRQYRGRGGNGRQYHDGESKLYCDESTSPKTSVKKKGLDEGVCI
jgi:hypothetical protein